MEIDEYFNVKLKTLAEKILESEEFTPDYLENLISENDEFVTELLEFRKSFIDSKDTDRVRGLLCLGFFKMKSGIDRTTCFILTIEIEESIIKNDWEKRCESYNSEQPLFKNDQNLFEQIRKKENNSFDYELLNSKELQQINDSEILKFKEKYTLLDYTLNPSILAWAKDKFEGKPLYIRANPYKVFITQPPQRLFESILMPANPNWWKQLTIFNRCKEGAAYELENCSPKENLQQFLEYNIKAIRRLEIIAKRNNNGNFSMMIEEITDIGSSGLLFGRMIHMDTDSPYGKDFEQSTLNHLDLAINIYEGETAKKRLEDNLARGEKTVYASFRTHLLRIEDIPFKGLFGFVTSFLESQTLVNEWFEDQFQEFSN